MPKAMQYTRGSIIYFEGDNDYRIFIVQQGAVLLTSTDIETGNPVSEQIRNGEFFGVKSALGHFPREEAATALVPTVVLVLTVSEFELLVSKNKTLILKMLKVFSNQLRSVHKKTESILNNIAADQKTGLRSVADAFFEVESFRAAYDVYGKLFTIYPELKSDSELASRYKEAGLKKNKKITDESGLDLDADDQGSLKMFSLPAFARFAKEYEPGQVIISEFEPGNSFYIIQSGQVELIKCVNGTLKNLDVLKPGEFFGEMAILDNSPRSATCIAKGKVKCLEFNKENFEVLITGNPQMALLLLKLFCKRIYDQKKRFKILVIKDLQARLYGVFLMLDEMNPINSETEKMRRFNVTINEIAHWAGLNVEVTADELQKIKSMRKIEIFDNYIIINNINDIKRSYDSRVNIGTL